MKDRRKLEVWCYFSGRVRQGPAPINGLDLRTPRITLKFKNCLVVKRSEVNEQRIKFELRIYIWEGGGTADAVARTVTEAQEISFGLVWVWSTTVKIRKRMSWAVSAGVGVSFYCSLFTFIIFIAPD